MIERQIDTLRTVHAQVEAEIGRCAIQVESEGAVAIHSLDLDRIPSVFGGGVLTLAGLADYPLYLTQHFGEDAKVYILLSWEQARQQIGREPLMDLLEGERQVTVRLKRLASPDPEAVSSP